MFVGQEVDHRSGLPCLQGAQMPNLRGKPRPIPARRISAPLWHDGGAFSGCKITKMPVLTLETSVSFSVCMRHLNVFDCSTLWKIHMPTTAIWSVKVDSHVNGDLYKLHTQSWELSRRHCYVVHVNATPMRPNWHHMWYQMRVSPLFSDDGIIEMLQQELAAHKVATKNVFWPRTRPHWVMEAAGSKWKKAAKFMMAITLLLQLQRALFFR